MKQYRLNLCNTVREALIAENISTVAVVNAVNGAMEECRLVDSEDKASQGKITKATKKQGARYRFTHSIKDKYEGTVTIALKFDTWHGLFEQSEQIAPCQAIELPECFMSWLRKFKVETPEEKAEREKREQEALAQAAP